MRGGIPALSLIFFTLITPTQKVIAQSESEAFLLPVEVLGAEGTIKSRTLTLDAELASKSERIWLQVNSLSYENKGSVKINDGSWYDLNHSSVDMQYQEKVRGGMAHGGFSTIRFSIPASGFTTGENTIYFRFNQSDGISIGYRVIRFNLLDENGLKLLDDSYFEEDDPNEWVGPYTDATSIDEGEDLWRNGSLWSNYLDPADEGFWYDAVLKPFQPIQATCADCHTQDGRDLELFSYSNESIIERAKFHNLSEEEGKKIASYIRSLSAEHDNVNRHGRPWNPPYQPGPQLKDKPIEYWAAGAGLDAVLDSDDELLDYMFPDGVTPEAVQAYFDSDRGEDRTILPLAVQMADWKRWLPMIHPKDAYTKGTFYTDGLTNGDLNPDKGYADFRTYMEGLPRKADGVTIDMASMNAAEVKEVQDAHVTFHRNFRHYFEQYGADRRHWRTTDGHGMLACADDISKEFAATSMARLMAVKNFEIMQEFNLQDQAPDYLLAEDNPTRRQWLHGKSSHNVFEIPSHFTGCLDGDCNTFLGQEERTGEYETTIWYELQGILAGGEGMQWWNGPVDYNYHPEFILSASNSSGNTEVLRYYHGIGTMYKTKTWSGDLTPNDGRGFRIRVQGPWYFFGKEGDTGSAHFHKWDPGYWPRLLDEVEPGLTKMVLDALIREFLDAVGKHDIASWTRWTPGNDKSNYLDPIAKSTVQDITGTVDNTEPLWADHTYWSIQMAIELGVECTLVDELIAWAQEAWPNIDWTFNNVAPTVTLKFNDNASLYRDLEYIDALASSPGDNPTYEWRVNGSVISNTDSRLSTADLSPGDVVSCTVTSNSPCVDNNQVTAEIGLPGDVKIQSRLNDGTWVDLDGTDACIDNTYEVRAELNIDPLVWLDATNIADGDEPADGDPVQSWYDRSGSGNNATVDDANIAPTYDADGLNGVPALEFGASGYSVLKLLDASQTNFYEDDWTVFIVHKTLTGTALSNTIGNKNGSTGDGWVYRTDMASTKSHVSVDDHRIYSNPLVLPISVVGIVTKKDNELSFYHNGTLQNSVTLAGTDVLNSGDHTYLGKIGFGSSDRYHKGHVGEVIIFDRAVLGDELEMIEGYLSHKWGLDDQLASTNNFKEYSPLALELTAPNGDQHVFSATKDSYSYQIAENSDYGNLKITPRYSDANYEVTINNPDEIGSIDDAVAFSVNGGADTVASTAHIVVGDELVLKPAYDLGLDYQWIAPDNQTFDVNTNVTWTGELGHSYEGTWTLKVIGSTCSSHTAETTLVLTVSAAAEEEAVEEETGEEQVEEGGTTEEGTGETGGGTEEGGGSEEGSTPGETGNGETGAGLPGVYQYGRVNITQNSSDAWTTVQFATAFAEPPVVVAGPLTYFGDEPATYRIKNVSTTGFDIQIDQWDYLSGTHSATENIYYMALSEGEHDLGGLKAEAGTVTAGTSWESVSLTSTFEATPVIFAARVTEAGPEATVEQIRNVTASSFEIKLTEESAGDQIHTDETVHYVAMAIGDGALGTIPIEAGRTAELVDENWHRENFSSTFNDTGVIAHLQTANGERVGALRQQKQADDNIRFVVQQELSVGAAVDLPFEEVGWLRIAEISEDEIILGTLPVLDAEWTLAVDIYPNPTQNTLNIEASQVIEKLEINDLSGKLMISIGSTDESMRLDVSQFNEGLYLLRIFLGNGSVVHTKMKKE